VVKAVESTLVCVCVCVCVTDMNSYILISHYSIPGSGISSAL